MITSSDANEGVDTQPPLENSSRKLIHDLPPILPDACIYRVPETIRSVNKKAYTPQLVSIGPLHHRKKELQGMEEHKLRYLQALLDRTKRSLEECIGVMKELEESARNCYAERIDLTSDQFVKMLLLDSCLIVEIILRCSYIDNEDPTAYLNKFITILGLKKDMILLENQIPFFVLHGLFILGISSYPTTINLLFILGISSYPTTMNLLHLSLFYFGRMAIFEDHHTKFDNVSRYLERDNYVKHFVDLLRICHLPPTLQLPSKDTSKQCNESSGGRNEYKEGHLT